MENELVLLPNEVKELALKVSEEKQQEVQTVLTQIFQGTADWEKQVDAIEVKDINDSMSIQMADAARKNAKTARLSAEKIFDAKRSEVQERMQDDKLEDALWLKSKQIMQLKFKHIEEKAEFKANFIKRHEAEQLQLRTELRYQKVLKFIPDEQISSIELSSISDEMFNLMLSGLEKEYNDRIAAEKKAELERIEAENKRIAEEKRIREENEKLKKEAEEKEKQRLIEIEKDRKEHEANMRAAHAEREKQAKENAIIQAELNAEKQAKERELQLLKDAEQKEKQRLLDIEQKRIKEEKAAQLAPDKDKLLLLAKSIINLPLPVLSDKKAIKILDEVTQLLFKVDGYIKEKVSEL